MCSIRFNPGPLQTKKSLFEQWLVKEQVGLTLETYMGFEGNHTALVEGIAPLTCLVSELNTGRSILEPVVCLLRQPGLVTTGR